MKFPTMILTTLAVATTALAGAAHADAIKLADSGVARKIDCGGRDLTITGDDNKLTISGCAVINVVGNRNQITTRLLPASSIAALGDNNHIIFLHAPGFEVQVSSSGKDNEIVPDMSRDLGDTSPVKFPISSASSVSPKR